MNFLLDTNVVSEWAKPRPNIGVLEWLASVDEDQVYVSVVTFTELRFGIERLAASKRKQQLHTWLELEMPPRFDGRIIPIDLDVANTTGRLLAASQSVGRRMQTMDGFIAAMAQLYDLTLVTRNVTDFQHVLQRTLNPWRDIV
jgi:hypothetical protein